MVGAAISEMHNRIHFLALIAVIATSSLAHAEDLRKEFTWVKAEGSPPKLGLQPKDPDHRSMSYDYVYMECGRQGQVTVAAWPIDRRARAPKAAVGLTVVTDRERHVLPNPKRSFNEMDEAWQVSATTSDLAFLRTMLQASSIRLDTTGLSLVLPMASRDVGAFLKHCEQFRR
ncbi:hypothetical protein MPEAHAMD_3766 [Methylobacterium frigidaeris]|uniref:Invasion associated locus B family protein n=3 Tax=Methylobacterium frigidaeris TaxID=2038277 RepID=A0AA37M697_9HYPH|nr:hypothetical protein MPEAHAMD_3766 [Methylobacterium frigidaeris]